jgi:hypothetical protein
MHPQDESEHAAEAPVGGEAAAEVGGGRVSVFLVLLFAFASFTLLLPVVCLRPALGFFFRTCFCLSFFRDGVWERF